MFQKAEKSQSKLRLAIEAPSGGGKTYTALRLATAIARLTNQKGIALIDTEKGSATKYADEFDFDVCNLEGSFHPDRYIEAIQFAQSQGYSVLIIDSISHEWMGADGILELVDRSAGRMRNPNKYAAWRDVTPLHNRFVETMLQSNCHVIATMRSKQNYVMEADETSGKSRVRKVGMAPIQREGIDFEFDVVMDINLSNEAVITKTRCKALTNRSFPKPGEELAKILVDWLCNGTTTPSPVQRRNGKPLNGRSHNSNHPYTNGKSVAVDYSNGKWKDFIIPSGSHANKKLIQIAEPERLRIARTWQPRPNSKPETIAFRRALDAMLAEIEKAVSTNS